MNYPHTIEQKIGFDSIKKLIEQYCKSDIGRKIIEDIAFSTSQHKIEESMNLCYEMKNILQYEDDFTQPSFQHIYHLLSSIIPHDTYIEGQDFLVLKNSLVEINTSIQFFTAHANTYPQLYAHYSSLHIPVELIREIHTVIDDAAQIRPQASPELQKIREALVQKQRQVSHIMNQALKLAKKEEWCDAESELTIRNGRLVLPLFAACKRKVKGVVHDESATGKTSFVEPIETFELHNDITQLELEEKKEIIKILKRLTSEIRPHIPDIKLCYNALAEIDALIAKALFAIRIDANKPNITRKAHISLTAARHPLLIISFEESKRQVVPLHCLLDEKQRILVLSGPNAGGKSVCLKTVILIQYMAQCGLLIPAHERSMVGIFSSICIDIGDEQSLENDLSTYSSHLNNMKYFVEHATPTTLFAIDEFGTGTEPLLGGAIAESVLETLHQSGAYGLITTHYTNLKHAATALEFAINGAMLFDLEQLKPLYKLRIGSAGSSFAFEIAQDIGLPQAIITQAKNKLGKEHVDFDKNLKKLEEEKQYIFKKKEEIRKQREEIKKLQHILSEKTQKIDKEKSAIIMQAKQDMQQLLLNTNKTIEATIKEIKEHNAEKEATRQAREKLATQSQHAENQLRKKEKNTHKNQNNTTTKELAIGDYAKIKGQTTAGEIIDIKQKKATLQYAHATITMPLQSLERAEKPKQKQAIIHTTHTTKHIMEKRSTFSTKLDIRGHRADDALQKVADFIETAHILQIYTVEILHGKGYGILRQLARNYLQSNTLVQSFTDAPIEMGGDGITIVTLD